MNVALETLLLALAGDAGEVRRAPALFLGAAPHPALAGWAGLTGWQPFKPLAQAWEHAGHARTDEPVGRWPLVLVLPGKSRDETLGWFGLARAHLAPGGRLVVAMANSSGAARFEKELKQAVGALDSQSKHKCRVFQAIDNGSWDEARIAGWRALLAPRPVAGAEHLQAVAGTFSCEHVDAGSAFLAANLPAHLRGRVADLGAGWGFLSDALLRRCPAVSQLDLFEADARALACARTNLAGHRGCQPGFHWHDVTSGLPAQYDAIVMNPPFHTGQLTDASLGGAFITTAAAALVRGGRLYLAANRQLPYEAVLDRCGLVWRCAAENATFKLLFADRRA